MLFLDTGYHFAETIGTRDAVAATYPVEVKTVTHPLRVPEHEAEYGRLYEIDPDLCCAIRKIWPLDRALRPYDAWASGVRRAELASRADTPVVGWDAKRRKVKVNPLATWTDEQVARIRCRTRHPGQPAATDRICLHRLRPVHPTGSRRRRLPSGSVGRAGEVRMRDPLMSTYPHAPIVPTGGISTSLRRGGVGKPPVSDTGRPS